MKLKPKQKPEIEQKQQQRAFTLLEAVVVVMVVGVLTSVFFAVFNSSRVKARDAKRLADMKTLLKALEIYYNDNSSYPKFGAPNTAYDLRTALSGSVPTVAPNYLNMIPADPLFQPDSADAYKYVWNHGGKDYGVGVYYEENGKYCKYDSPGGSARWFDGAPECAR